MAAVYSAYEFGYLVNDAITVRRETHPTVRLGRSDQDAVARRLPAIFILRTGFGICCLAALGLMAKGWGLAWKQPVAAGAAIILLIHLTYLAYNRLRGRITIPLFLLLVSLRFAGPVLMLASATGRPSLSLLGVLLATYPVINALEFSGKARFSLPWVQAIPPKVDAWRLAAYGLLVLVAWLACRGSHPAANAFRLGSTYFLGYRILTYLVARAMPTRTAPRGTP